ncbi:MAG: hypothetical protein Fur0046_21360 [Cyanobacteria bacterium J069]|nr:MAG: hypothetical protein D6742_09040 [Cyanobacteria bacterium J069]
MAFSEISANPLDQPIDQPGSVENLSQSIKQGNLKGNLTPHRLSDLWQNLVGFLAGTSEPKIQELSHKNGSIVWEIYDPYTQSKTICTSENEVRQWIEQRYSSK